MKKNSDDPMYKDLDYIRGCVEAGGKEFAIQEAGLLPRVKCYYVAQESEFASVLNATIVSREVFLDMLMDGKTEVVGYF